MPRFIETNRIIQILNLSKSNWKLLRYENTSPVESGEKHHNKIDDTRVTINGMCVNPKYGVKDKDHEKK